MTWSDPTYVVLAGFAVAIAVGVILAQVHPALILTMLAVFFLFLRAGCKLDEEWRSEKSQTWPSKPQLKFTPVAGLVFERRCTDYDLTPLRRVFEIKGDNLKGVV